MKNLHRKFGSTPTSFWKLQNYRARNSGEIRCARPLYHQRPHRAICNPDAPKIAAAQLPTRVYPTFRLRSRLGRSPPRRLQSLGFERLAAAANVHIRSFPGFLDALRKRQRFLPSSWLPSFDHGLAHCYANFCSESRARAIFEKARSGQAATHEEHAEFASHLMLYFGHLDAQSGWTKQLHLGALRKRQLPRPAIPRPDSGYDSIGDFPQAESLGAYLNQLDRGKRLAQK